MDTTKETIYLHVIPENRDPSDAGERVLQDDRLIGFLLIEQRRPCVVELLRMTGYVSFPIEQGCSCVVELLRVTNIKKDHEALFALI